MNEVGQGTGRLTYGNFSHVQPPRVTRHQHYGPT
jgi:hypothetical protein